MKVETGKKLLIAAVLLMIGLGLPILYFGMFFSQLNAQAERFKLGAGRKVYSVTLSAEGVSVHNLQRAEEDLNLPWKGIGTAYRRKDCIYLYVTPQKAFLLPSGQADAPDQAVWDCIDEHLQQNDNAEGGRKHDHQ